MPPALGRVRSIASALCSIIARKRFSLRFHGALAPREAPGGERDQGEHRRRGEQRAHADEPGLLAPGREHRGLGGAGGDEQRKAAYRRRRDQHVLVQTGLGGPAVEAPAGFHRL